MIDFIFGWYGKYNVKINVQKPLKTQWKLHGLLGTPGQWKSSTIKNHNLLVTSSKNVLFRKNMELNTSQYHQIIQL